MQEDLYDLIKEYGVFSFHAGVHSGEDQKAYQEFTDKQDLVLSQIIDALNPSVVSKPMLTAIRNLDQVAVLLKAVTPELIDDMSAGQRKVIGSFLGEQAKRYGTDKEG